MTDDHNVDSPTTDIPVHIAPTEREVRRARTEATAAVADAEEQLPRRVRNIAEKAASKTARRIGLVFAIFATLLALAASLWAVSVSTDARQRAATAQQSVDAAISKLDLANATLRERGQATVPAPVDPTTPTDAITAAVLAQVLAQLPATPTADQVAAILQGTVTANVLGPSLDELSAQVSSYFTRNPPIPGPAPTAQQIQAAVDLAYARNPPKDGQSPPCLSTPSMCQGATGPDGKPGQDSTVPGPGGQQGAPPNSWSWPDPVAPAVVHTCTRAGGTDAAPDYACT